MPGQHNDATSGASGILRLGGTRDKSTSTSLEASRDMYRTRYTAAT
jgi:hypothetical protein